MAPLYKRSVAGIAFDVFNYIFILAFAFFCLYPFLLSFMVSISAESSIKSAGYRLVPNALSLEAYRHIFKGGSRVLRAYKITITVTVLGTLLSIFTTSMLAYVLANKDAKYRKHITFFIFFTMVFHAGLAPWYIVVTGIGLRNSIWALILPAMVSAWFVFILRTFFQGIPNSIPESARIDGANEMQIYLRLILPLSVPGVATISLFYALFYWNDWWLCILLISDRALFPLQYLLRVIMQDIVNAMPEQIAILRPEMKVPEEAVRMATMMVTIGPIILVYPFVQRYFVKGITIGAIKG
jgi:ABC-type glycerol-3-phosphate transport system permease component